MTDSITFRAQCARDAQAAGYGDVSYWLALERSSHELRGRYLERQDWDAADNAINCSLSEALAGNDGA